MTDEAPATNRQYCEVDIGHRPCLPLPVCPPTGGATAQGEDLVYETIPGETN